jgi:hypothetical protein
MKRWTMVGSVGVVALLLVAAACHTSNNSTSNGCDELFTGYLARCEYSGYPASEVTRVQARWDAYCEGLTTLPGVTFTASGLADCAKAVETMDCNAPSTPPACAGFSTGTLAGGAGCLASNQCQSASCSYSSSSDGGTPVCGSCDTPVANGQACGTPGTSCLPNAECSGGTCLVYDAGAPTAPVAAGGACGTATTGNCGAGLVCSNGSCASPTYGAAGQPCDYGTKACLVGSCGGGVVMPEPDGGIPTPTGTCPTVIADGQPCDGSSAAATCDTYAACIGGICQATPSATLCK